MNSENMGDLISKLRKQHNMSQKDLADKLNVTDKAVSKWERGISCPDINTIPKLAEVLNISVQELLTLRKDLQKAISDDDLTINQKINRIVTLVFKAVGMAMGIAVLVLSVMSDIKTDSAITMLAIGVTCIGISLLQSK